MRSASRLRTAGLTALALVAFAANSWLCRAALRTRSIDPATFTAARVAAGAAMLALLVALTAPSGRRSGGSFASAAVLFAYAIAFSLAYLELATGVGALVLFGAVQLTMTAGGWLRGRKPAPAELAGMAAALAGLALLGLPGATAPAPRAAAGMFVAGVAWGIYSLRGRAETRPPLAVTAGNFARAVPLAVGALALAALLSPLHASPRGLALAAISGAITSGVGYAIWYAALPGLEAIEAGLVQLAVPVLTAVGGVLLLGERFTLRLGAASALVLGGIALALVRPLAARARPGDRPARRP